MAAAGPGGRCFTATADGIVLAVRLTPRASREGVDGVGDLGDGTMVAHVRVRAAPHDGEANAALVALIAKQLKCPKSRVTIVSGASARVKRLGVEGDPAALAAIVEAWPRV